MLRFVCGLNFPKNCQYEDKKYVREKCETRNVRESCFVFRANSVRNCWDKYLLFRDPRTATEKMQNQAKFDY